MMDRIVVLLFAAVLPCCAFQTSQPAKASLNGTVIDSLTHQPLRKAHVSLSVADPKSDDSWGLTTDESGSFSFENLDGGKYIVSADKLGYLGYPTRGYSGDSTERALTLHLSAGQSLSSVQLKLTPQGVLSGRVVDGDGDPCEHCSVGLLRRTWSHGRQKLQTVEIGNDDLDDRAEFRFAGLAPGKYYLFARSEAASENEMPASTKRSDRQGPVTTYYPDALDPERALPVPVAPGQQVSGLEIRLQQLSVYSVSGRVAGLELAKPASGPAQSFVVAHHRGSRQDFGFNSSAPVHTDGSFLMRGITPGSYDLELAQSGGPFTLARTPVDVGSQDVTGVVLQVSPQGTLTGKVQLESGKAMNGVPLSIFLLNDAGDFVLGSPAEPDGSFAIPGLLAGNYTVSINGLPDSVYLESIYFGGAATPNRAIEWTGNPSAQLRVVISQHGAQISGQVTAAASSGKDANTETPAAQTVVLIPNSSDVSIRELRTKETKTEMNSSFTMKGVAPGSYKLYAFERIEEDAWTDEDLLSQFADTSADLTVKPDESAAVTLSPISAKAVEQALAKAGLQ